MQEKALARGSMLGKRSACPVARDYLPARSENLFEVTLTVPGFAHPLRVYTRDRAYTLDKEIWARLRVSVTDAPISLAVKALRLSTSGAVETPVSAAAHSTFVIAPVDAPGKIVYWSLADGLGSLKGFGIGEEGVEKLEGTPTYSPAHWSAGDRIAVLGDSGDLIWVQLDGDRQGVLARDGDARQAIAPTFRHDGTGIAYVSTNSISLGRQAAGPSDLYAVPWAGGLAAQHRPSEAPPSPTTPSTTRPSRLTTRSSPSPGSRAPGPFTACPKRRCFWSPRSGVSRRASKNQPPGEGNHTPSLDDFKIPSIVIN